MKSDDCHNSHKIFSPHDVQLNVIQESEIGYSSIMIEKEDHYIYRELGTLK